MTFKELYLSGQIEFDEIDRYISRWNRSDDERTLAKYLGLNAEEAVSYTHLTLPTNSLV